MINTPISRNGNKTVFVVLGPTCSGKTSLSIDLCKKFNGSIISADSRQVVKHMDIGTGKLPVGDFGNAATPISNSLENEPIIERSSQMWRISGVDIWGYDLTVPDEYYTAVDWARFALNRTHKLLEQGKTVFLVGGTGFYLDIFTHQKTPAGSKPDLELRKSLETTPTKNLLTWLMSLNPDPQKFKHLDKKNRVRIIRALEIELKKEKEKTTPLPYLRDVNFKFIGLTADRHTLYSRADAWVEKIWKCGVLNETQKLLDLGYAKSPKLNGLIYRTCVSYIREGIPEKEAVQRIKFDMHAYIRRQQTYFKKMPGVHWLDIANATFVQDVRRLISA
jgi:tRNA dimethylallyltransferase